MSTTANRILKNSSYLYMNMIFSMFISLFSTRVILQQIGTSDFGIYSVVGGAIGMLGFLNAAMSNATQRFMSYVEGEGDREKQKVIFNVSFLLHLILALILLVILYIAGYFFFNGILNIPSERVEVAKIIYGCFMISTAFTVASVPYDAVMNAHENMKYYAVISSIFTVIKLLITISLIYVSSDKLTLYGILTAVATVFNMIVLRFYCHRKYDECNINLREYFSFAQMKQISSFATWNLLSAATSIISQYGLSIVLNNFWGTLLNTAQGIANQISGQLMVFSNTMLKALTPVITKSEGSGNRTRMLKASMAGSKFSYMILVFFAIPFLMEMPKILNFWLGTVPAWAIVFCRLQLLRNLTEQLTITLGRSISAQGDIKSFTIIKSILSMQPIILTSILFYFDFPPYYMYIVWILCGGCIGGCISIYYFKKKCGASIRLYFKEVIFPCIIMTIVMWLVGTICQHFMSENFIRIIILTIITSIAGIIILYSLLTDEESKAINNIYVDLKNKFKKND